MNSLEKRATFSIASLFSLRMLGLFMILPVFSPYASTLKGATPLLTGMALGIYGLTQALGQLPFGMLSDRYPRKHIVAIGLSIFALGSVIAALSTHINGIILGRALQGAGAIGSTLIALLADTTRPEERSKAMAIIGVIIGMSFFMAMILGPVLNQWTGIAGIFWMTAFLALFAIMINYRLVPSPPTVIRPLSHQPVFTGWQSLLKNKTLISLDIGIFCLHAILTASFVVLPLMLMTVLQYPQHDSWKVYLPSMLIAVTFTFILLAFAERQKRIPALYKSMIGLLCLAMLSFSYEKPSLIYFIINLTLFFTAFNTLEANLPSLVSRLAPDNLKGTAIGIYSTCQYAGIFCGGIFGGLLDEHYTYTTVLFVLAWLALAWFLLALGLPLKIKSPDGLLK